MQLGSSTVLFAQSGHHKAGTTLTLDANVRTGVLPNGFTYYIRRNVIPKGRVYLYMANKVGSILEDNDQLGLAHFMEHMNFNGTVHYPKNELVDYLQKIGVRFGADLNASTNFDATIYQLPIPSDQPELVKNGLIIMHDWAQGATLDTKEINSERGVILEEKRLSNTAGLRMQMQYLPVVLNHSKYADRWPIGTEEVLKTFKPEVLKRFYQDWYRPNLQALVVVGDITVDSLEKQIRTQFADLKNPKQQRSAQISPVQLNGDNHFISVTDKENSGASINVMVKMPELVVRTTADYRKEIMRKLFTQIMNARFSELALRADPAFIDAGSYIGGYIGHIDTYNTGVNLKPGEYEGGFKALWHMQEQAKRFGFTARELSRAKKQYLSELTTALKEKDKASSSQYVNEYVQLFLTGEASPGVTKEYNIANAALSRINLTDINLFVKQLMIDRNRDIVITASEKDKNNLPVEIAVRSWMTSVEKEKLLPYEDKVITRPLLAIKPVPGKITGERTIPSLGITELTLSNGIKVLLKPTNYQNEEIVFNGFGPGGTSLYSDADFESANNAVDLIAGAGAGSFTTSELEKLTTGHQIGINPYMDENHEGIRGSATPGSLEMALQLVHLYFTKPRKDTANFNNFLTRSKASIAEISNDPNSAYNDTIISAFHNYNIRYKGPSIEKINSISLNRSYDIYKERFGNARNFTFIFIGSFDPLRIRPLLESYLASLPALPRRDTIVDLGIGPVRGQLTKKVFKGDEEKSHVEMVFSGKYNYNISGNLQLDALGEILEYKLVERLRELESGVYTPNVTINHNKVPHGEYSIFIGFSCAPQNTDKLIAATLDEIDKIKTAGATATDVQKYQEEAIRSNELQLKQNYYWFSYLTGIFKNGGDPESILNYNESLKQITSDSIKDAANTYLNGENLIKFILLPEKYNNKTSK